MEKMKKRLLEIILEKSFQYTEKPTFKLVSGGVSNFYFNCKPTMLDPEGKELIGRLVFAKIRDLDISGIGGLELGSVPISSAACLISQLEGKPLKEFIVKKREKRSRHSGQDGGRICSRGESGGGRRCNYHWRLYHQGH